MNRLTTTAVMVACLMAFSAQAEQKTYQHDQYDSNIFQAANQINGSLLQVEPGFVQSEAFGALFRPQLDEYPIKLLGLDVFFAGPLGYALNSSAYIEVYLDAGSGPEPTNTTPDFVIDTTEFYNPATGDFGIQLQPNTAYQFDFNYEEEGGAPPLATQGNILVMVRFKEPSADLSEEWGTKTDKACVIDEECGNLLTPGICAEDNKCITPLMECSTLEVIPGVALGCGCQPLAMILDGNGLSPQTNIMHLVWPLGQCSGSKEWKFFEDIQNAGKSLGGDVIIRVRAETSGVGPTCSCTGKECGDDGCGNPCGTCGDGETCESGLCVGPACSCDGKACGPDGCGGSCGTCALGQVCEEGVCTGTACTCDGKQCGDDGCGNSCGTCGDDETCSESGQCEPVCGCDGKECGDDGCGNLCGQCGDGEICTDNQCVDDGSGTDADATDATDGTDETDATDATDGTDAADAVDGADGTDATDVAPVETLSITSIDPAFGRADEQTPIAIVGTGFVGGMEFKVGGRDLIAVQVTGSTLAQGTVPSGLNPGTYSVIAVTPDERTATFVDAFEVTEAPSAGGGDSGCASTPGSQSGPFVAFGLLFAVALLVRRRGAHKVSE